MACAIYFDTYALRNIWILCHHLEEALCDIGWTLYWPDVTLVVCGNSLCLADVYEKAVLMWVIDKTITLSAAAWEWLMNGM